MNWKALGKVLWHGASIAVEAANLLETSGALRLSGKGETALLVAAAIEHAAGGQITTLQGSGPR